MNTLVRNSWDTLPTTSQYTIALPYSVSDWIFSVKQNDQDFPKDILQWNKELPESVVSFQQDLVNVLMNGLGVVRIQLDDRLGDDELRSIYAGISRLIGELNDRYGLFFDVIDQGLDYTKEAIPVSKTNAETGFHTDSTAKNYFPDVVGLLCLHAAKNGGDSLVVNASNLYEDVLTEKPNWKNLLHQPLFRDVITPGTKQTIVQIKENNFPLFDWVNENLVFRYMRYWIESAYEKLNVEFPNDLVNLMDYIDAYFSNPKNVLQFQMTRGDIVYVNNRFLCHNRTKFEDGMVPRRLVRTWINL